MAAAKPKPVDQKAVWAQIQANFGLTDALLDMDKTNPKKGFTLREAFEQIRKQKITDPARAAQILAKTNWFKTYGTETTKRLVAEKTGQGAFKEQLRAQTSALRDALAAKGIALSDKEAAAIARDAYVFQLNQSQIMDRIGKAASFKTTGDGELGVNEDTLNSLAYANGVKVADADKSTWLKQIALGQKSVEDYEATIRENAASRYTVFADQIRSGQNLTDLTRPYRQMMAELLEVGPDEVDFDDPLMKDGKAFTAIDQSTGQPAVKPLWEFRREVMKDSRWQYTQNARDSASSFGAEVLKRFGMIA